MSGLEAIREATEALDIEFYLDREGITYRHTHGSRGPQLNLQTCPVCGGDKWKVYFGQDTGFGNCFSGSCEAKFTKYSLIKAISGLEGRKLVEHIKHVAAEQGWRPAKIHSVAVHSDPSKLKLPNSLEIPINGRNLGYLENRGITISIAKYFHLRFCHKGLFRYEREGRVLYQSYDMRVIIPIYDLDGELVSFQGRDILGTAEKKYLFPPGYASTGAHLYNGHNVINTKRVVVGEGAFDVAALKIALDQEPDTRDVVPVGTFGKSLSANTGSDDQLCKFMKLKERGVEEVTFMWDGEPKAIQAAVTAGLVLMSIGFKVRIGVLPEGKDPNEVTPDVCRRAFYQAALLTPTSATSISLKASLGVK